MDAAESLFEAAARRVTRFEAFWLLKWTRRRIGTRSLRPIAGHESQAHGAAPSHLAGIEREVAQGIRQEETAARTAAGMMNDFAKQVHHSGLLSIDNRRVTQGRRENAV